jgi:hypothetical protein
MTSQYDPPPGAPEGPPAPPPPPPAPLAPPTTPPIPGPAPESAPAPAPLPTPSPATPSPATPSHVAPPTPFAPPASAYPAPPAATPVAAAPGPRRKRPVLLIVLLSLLFVVLAGVIVALAVYLSMVLQRLDQAVDRIDELEQIVDSKETFSAAMQGLVDTAAQFDGMPYATIIDDDELTQLAVDGWESRRDPARIAAATQAVQAKTAELQSLLDAAAAQAAMNSTGSAAEAAVDALGHGFVTTVYDDADSLCESDVLGCVTGADPYVVHLDAADRDLEWMTEYIWTGVAYHEFAHVMQYTNPEATETAAASFGGDWETMADCFALTYLDGWALDQRVYITSYSWYDVSVGYGYTCDDAQRQVVRDWYAAVGYTAVPISQ